jgi:hypothetical protein
MATRMALKFLREGGVGTHSGFQWPLPNGKPGKWVKVTGTLEACENGIHAALPHQAMSWFHAECYVIELGGKVIDSGDKLVARKGRLIRRVDEWNDTTARLFTADCAERMLPIYEKAYPGDKRPRDAIRAARAYAKHPTPRNQQRMNAARAAARAAAWAAAWDAAGAAAWAAAWDAAGGAARDAAGGAARAWQGQRLLHYLNVPEVTE